MENYKEMYYELFSVVSDVIEQLKAIQLKTEKMYIECEDEEEE